MRSSGRHGWAYWFICSCAIWLSSMDGHTVSPACSPWSVPFSGGAGACMPWSIPMGQPNPRAGSAPPRNRPICRDLHETCGTARCPPAQQGGACGKEIVNAHLGIPRTKRPNPRKLKRPKPGNQRYGMTLIACHAFLSAGIIMPRRHVYPASLPTGPTKSPGTGSSGASASIVWFLTACSSGLLKVNKVLQHSGFSRLSSGKD